MNRIYRLVFNAATGLWTAVAENTRGRGKAGRAACALLAVLAIISPVAYAANAADAKVVGGTGSVATVGNATTIHQVSQRLAVDWTQLSTTAGEALNFVQPNAQAIALNRITGSTPSSFLGSLTANGQVFILNPNGILFGSSSQVNVGGIVASTLGMNPTDFMNGSNTFTKTTGTGSVVNQGSMTAAQGGYLALLAPEVRNEGVMTATLGTALLAAGNKVTLNLNNGSLLGYSIDQGAVNALAENKQLIKADGGQVLLSAKALDALTTATVNNTGVIEAKTLQNIAGRIMLMGDMEYGTVNVGGTLDASAPMGSGANASVGGNGGFIETSAAKVKVADSARITTKADAGKNGKWLIDPTDFTIAASGGDMTGTALTNALANGSVEIQSTAGAGGVNGDINVNDLVQWSANILTLNAQRNINFSSLIIGSGTGKLALKYGQSALAAGNTADYKLLRNGKIGLAAGQNFSTQLGSDGAVVNYQVITSLGAEGSVTGTDLQGINGNLAGNYALGASIDAAATASWNSNAGFDPLGVQTTQFTGRFTGLGQSIGTLTINRTTNDVGMFGVTRAGSVIRNLALVNASVRSTGNRVGGLVGIQFGVVANSSVSGTVRADTGTAGMLTGLMNVGSEISDSDASGTVTGLSSIGGLVGFSNGKIANSHSGASVSAGNNNVGGLVGFLRRGAEITNSYATGNVTGLSVASSNLGGLIGTSEGTVSGSYATGSVSGANNVGGLIGFVSEGTVSGSYATGSATATASFAGGLIGALSSTSNVLNAYATGAVTGNIYVGGLVGRNSGIIRNTYATGSVTANNNFGNLTGEDIGNIFSSYTSANSLRQQATFLGWDIDAIGGTGKVWRIYEGNTAPLLRSFLTQLTLPGASTVVYNGSTQLGATTSDARVQGAGASGRNVGTYNDTYFSNQQGVDVIGSQLSITRANLVLSTSNVTKTYDSGLSALGTAVATAGTQLLGGDTASGGSFAFTDKNFGLGNKTVTASGVTVNDTNGGNNYNISYANNTSSTINKAALLVTAAGSDKTYDGNTAASVTYGDNRMGTDALTFSGSAAFVSKNAANSVAVNVTGITLGGADAGNYTANTTATTSARIAPKALTYTTTASDKVYDGNRTASASLALAGLVGTETLGSTAGATFNSKDVAGANLVTVNTVALADGSNGGLASNYSAAAGGTGAARITPKALSYTTSAQNKVYDGNTSAVASISNLSGFVAGETVSVLGNRATFNSKDVLAANLVTVNSAALADGAGGGLASNYSAAGGTAAAHITPKALLATANNDSKDFGGLPYAGGNGVQLQGLVAGETAANLNGALTYGGTAQGAKAAGSYSIAPGGLTSSNYSLQFADGTLTITPADAATTAVGGPTLSAAYKSTLDSLARLNFSNVKFGSSDDDRAVLEALNAAAEEE